VVCLPADDRDGFYPSGNITGERGDSMFDFSFLKYYQQEFMEGLITTITVSLFALGLSLVIGTIIAILRISNMTGLRWLGTTYVEFFRNTPLVIQIFFFWIAFRDLSIFYVGLFGLSIYTASYMAEAIRAGIQAVPKGQMEAARSSGLSYLQAMYYVILPQAFKWIIPPLGNQFLNLVKNSSVLAIIAGHDLLYAADVASIEGDITPVYFFAALLYLSLTIPLSLGVNYFERRFAKSGKS
jgi:aspartate/glutamate/glutamine transport system permease protein